MNKFLIIKPHTGIITAIFITLGLVGAAGIYLKVSRVIGSFALILFSYTFFAGVIHNCFLRKLEINEDGVKYITPFVKYKMTWQEIGTIGISDIFIGRQGWKPWIYFSTDKEPVKYVSPKMMNDKFFMLNYRKSVIEEIRKYSDLEILNLYELPLPHEKRDYSGMAFKERLRGNNCTLIVGVSLGFLWVLATMLLTGPVIAPFDSADQLAISSIALGFIIVLSSVGIYLGGLKKAYGTVLYVAFIVTAPRCFCTIFFLFFYHSPAYRDNVRTAGNAHALTVAGNAGM